MDNFRYLAKRIPVFNHFYFKYLKSSEIFLYNNRKEVLLMYRTLLKEVSRLCERKLLKFAKIEEIRYMFRSVKNEQYISSIKNHKQIGNYGIISFILIVFQSFDENSE